MPSCVSVKPSRPYGDSPRILERPDRQVRREDTLSNISWLFNDYLIVTGWGIWMSPSASRAQNSQLVPSNFLAIRTSQASRIASQPAESNIIAMQINNTKLKPVSHLHAPILEYKPSTCHHAVRTTRGQSPGAG